MTLTIITSKYILFTLERIIFAMLGLLKANHELDLSPSKIDDLKIHQKKTLPKTHCVSHDQELLCAENLLKLNDSMCAGACWSAR